jgi:uncharacterized protein YcnI
MRGAVVRKLCPGLALLGSLLFASSALGHASVSPPVSLSGKLQLYSLAVPTEKEGKATTKIVLTVPNGFSIDSFAPSAGWKRQVEQTGSGEQAVIQRVTWTGGKVPTDEDSVFQFLAQPGSNGSYTFHVQQTYSDGSIVNWAGPESSDAPAPTIAAKSSFGGGSSSTLTLVAIVVGAFAAVLAAVALFARGGNRPLA